MKLLLQFPGNTDIESKEFKPYFDLIKKEVTLVKRPDTDIIINPASKGFKDLKLLSSPGLRYVNNFRILQEMIEKGRENFDGIINACYLDPLLKVARQTIDIPVIGVAESSMYMALEMGTKFAVITTNPGHIPDMTEYIYLTGLSSRCIASNPVRALSISQDELLSGLGGTYGPVIDNFKKTAEGCIEDGAEIVIAGSLLLSPILTLSGINVLEAAAIIDPLLIGIKMTEMMVDLKKAGLPVISRKGLYIS
ncbi:MAG: aspartate/glutamate racemase family protein, partial [Thermodesulfobacteriota bacterium]|nr:aspartate/glutamate racemase family protein [Thermodesulfobacteriota bacterium]